MAKSQNGNGNNNVKAEICNIVWQACDTFRGAIDPAEYKNYILTMLFIKYMSDIWKDKQDELRTKYKGDEERVKRAMQRERFVLPDKCDFETLYEQRKKDNIGEVINIALEKIEDENKLKLENVFRNIDFNSESALGQTVERNRRLRNLLEDFNNPKLDMRPSRIGNLDIIGDVYEYLISQFASGAGKKAGEFYTPPEVSKLLAKLVAPKEGMRICDPACGSGSLLIKVGQEVGSENFFLAGQESNGSTWALCRMNMFLHGMDGARIEWCDTITSPRLVEHDDLMKFDIVVANPPFSLKKWGFNEVETKDPYNRFHRGVPPASKGDYAFITHMIEIAHEGKGRIGVVVPHGVLFRGASEGRIRKQLIDENLLDAVIGLPSALFYGTGIPASILIFNKGRNRKTDVLFIDASREYEDMKKQNRLREEDIDKIVKTYRDYKTVEGYSYRATIAEIQEAEFNLNIPRYVDTYQEAEQIDIVAVEKEIEQLEAQLAETRKEMKKYLKELGYGR